MKFQHGLILFLSAACVGVCSVASACTDFRLTGSDGTIIITRSMEFAYDLQSNVMTSPRGRQIKTEAPNGKPGMAWNAKYGYVYLDGLNTGFVIDGMNDQGLSFEALYLPGETQYQTVPDGQENKAMGYMNFGDWVLGNFKSADEVKAALSGIYVVSQDIPQAKDMVFPLHYSIFDATGKGIVIEFVAGKMNVFDNFGIMTNSPTYDWHITNLRNYVSLMPTTPQPIIATGMTFTATGQGAGMHGLPGDVSPPSRFVKIAAMLNTIITPQNPIETLNVAQHIINNVDIPLGFVREGKDVNTASNEYTQWVVFKDLTHKMFYYRTYEDMNLGMVNLNKINLNSGAPQLKIGMSKTQTIADVTAQLQSVDGPAATPQPAPPQAQPAQPQEQRQTEPAAVRTTS